MGRTAKQPGERDLPGVWRVLWGESFIYIYLLLDFQSTVEQYMP